MSRHLFMGSLIALLFITLSAAGCISSGSPAPGDLPQERLDRILTAYNYNGTAWIAITPVGDHSIGETFVLTAKTSLPLGERVLVQTWPVSFARADRYTIRNGTSQNVTVTNEGPGANTIALTVDAAEFREATYILSMEGPSGTASAATWYRVTAR